MIQIERLEIREFRGIRDLQLSLGCKSFVVSGPNGSGKSGVVDAIDFALTGNISRLSGAGSGGLSVLKHGPHVSSRDDPASAQVAVTVRDTVSGQTAVLTRSVKTARRYTLVPDIPEVRAAIEKAGQHHELTLSRREVIKFVLAEPGKRSQEVQALLKLERLGEIRGVLKTVQTKASTAERVAQGQVDAAEDALRRHLDLPTLLEQEFALVVNKQRAVLGLDPIDVIGQDTDLRQDVDADSSLSAFNKASAVRDVEALVLALSDGARHFEPAQRLHESLAVLDSRPNVLDSVHQRELIAAGLDLATEAQCPLSDLPWTNLDSLRDHLISKLARLDAAAKAQKDIEEQSRAVIEALERIRGLVTTATPFVTADASASLEPLRLWVNDLATFQERLGSVAGAVGERERLNHNPLRIPEDVLADLGSLLETLRKKPDQSATAVARTFLIVAQERWRSVRHARAELKKRAAAHVAARGVYETYCTVSDDALTSLYHTVEDEFSMYYREINADDESAFKAELESSAGKLDLRVDFHGRGMFPPGAYHSEGHQDGMGVCLYLALIKQLLGTNFRLAVLDDVVMSVDSNHRKQFCNLLKTKFPDVQFIITTHDVVWARQMHSSGLVAKAAQARFHGWTVDSGPVYEEAHDVWERINSDLAKDDVSPAAARLRRYLESTMADLADCLRGQVTYRTDGNYDLGELLSAVKGRHSKLLGMAAKAANSWGDESAKARVDAAKAARAAAVQAQEGETWAINPAVHFNEWANFSKADFVPVVETWQQFLALFSCDNTACESWIYVMGNPGNEEALRCRCGTLNLNLRSK